ncbi:hypothetical protein [Streptomyces griseus]|uniref:hypothetical protein n=1 Tax=Streptomyces griseus TaxID=1911 RepID=UPI00056C6A3A|nr:hypothetical protein [Streptomyces griseus]
MPLTRVTLTSGRTIDLDELRLSSTYGGMLEGYPFRFLNDRLIKGLLTLAENTYRNSPVHLVTPPRDQPEDAYTGAFGPMESLPPVACVGSFRSAAIAPEHDPVLYRSWLTVVWFQTSPTAPSGEDAEAGLRGVAWEELARDQEL